MYVKIDTIMKMSAIKESRRHIPGIRSTRSTLLLILFRSHFIFKIAAAADEPPQCHVPRHTLLFALLLYRRAEGRVVFGFCSFLHLSLMSTDKSESMFPEGETRDWWHKTGGMLAKIMGEALTIFPLLLTWATATHILTKRDTCGGSNALLPLLSSHTAKIKLPERNEGLAAVAYLWL